MPALGEVFGHALALTVIGVASVTAAASQPAADFYRSQRTLTLMVSSSAGGGYDGYARMFGRYMTRYLPGNPVFVINNMPGAGGARATSYINAVAPRDGTVIGIVNRGAPTIPLLVGPESPAQYDPTKFSWVGNAQTRLRCGGGEQGVAGPVDRGGAKGRGGHRCQRLGRRHRAIAAHVQ